MAAIVILYFPAEPSPERFAANHGAVVQSSLRHLSQALRSRFGSPGPANLCGGLHDRRELSESFQSAQGKQAMGRQQDLSLLHIRHPPQRAPSHLLWCHLRHACTSSSRLCSQSISEGRHRQHIGLSLQNTGPTWAWRRSHLRSAVSVMGLCEQPCPAHRERLARPFRCGENLE